MNRREFLRGVLATVVTAGSGMSQLISRINPRGVEMARFHAQEARMNSFASRMTPYDVTGIWKDGPDRVWVFFGNVSFGSGRLRQVGWTDSMIQKAVDLFR